VEKLLSSDHSNTDTSSVNVFWRQDIGNVFPDVVPMCDVSDTVNKAKASHCNENVIKKRRVCFYTLAKYVTSQSLRGCYQGSDALGLCKHEAEVMVSDQTNTSLTRPPEVTLLYYKQMVRRANKRIVCSVIFPKSQACDPDCREVLWYRRIYPSIHVPYGTTLTELATILGGDMKDLQWPKVLTDKERMADKKKEEEYKTAFRENTYKIRLALRHLHKQVSIMKAVDVMISDRLKSLAQELGFPSQVQVDESEYRTTMELKEALLKWHQETRSEDEEIKETLQEYGIQLQLLHVPGWSSHISADSLPSTEMFLVLSITVMLLIVTRTVVCHDVGTGCMI
jgi:hypothetical protein